MSTEPERGGLGDVFRAETLPRWRALLAVTGFAAALLFAGGMLEYGSGSPAIQGTPAATYWALFFGLNTLAFGGAALLAGFPRLGRTAVKLIWAAAAALLYIAAFTTWYGQQPPGGGLLLAWLARSLTYLPAALAVLVGLLLPGAPRQPTEADGAAA